MRSTVLARAIKLEPEPVAAVVEVGYLRRRAMRPVSSDMDEWSQPCSRTWRAPGRSRAARSAWSAESEGRGYLRRPAPAATPARLATLTPGVD
ncbi:hypothetical protein GCM10023086_67900 [Streptomyces venetus]|uniref:Uncharacterized protein n=1 Tax=Streptomyces venetus TaxID=1701086 RepID=A0ABP8H7E6_9ACTN